MQDRPETAARDERIRVERGDVAPADDRTAGRDTTDAHAPRTAQATAMPSAPTESAATPVAPPATPVAPANTTIPTATASIDAELLPRDVLDDFRARWDKVQVGFVDQPQEAVRSAHDLVDQLVERLSQSFSQQREGLEGSWNRGEPDTEALRKTLQQYRSFFNRLLST